MLLVSAPAVFLKPSFFCDGKPCTEDSRGCEEAGILDPNSLDSISKEFGLYCSKRPLRDFAESSVFIGALAGNFLFSLISINRRPHIGITWLIGSIGCFGLSFSPNIYVFIVFYIMAGFGILTAIMVHFAIMSEQGSKHLNYIFFMINICILNLVERFAQLGTLGCLVSWSVAEMLVGLIVYEFSSWRTSLRWFLGVPALVLNITYFLIYESPK